MPRATSSNRGKSDGTAMGFNRPVLLLSIFVVLSGLLFFLFFMSPSSSSLSHITSQACFRSTSDPIRRLALPKVPSGDCLASGHSPEHLAAARQPVHCEQYASNWVAVQTWGRDSLRPLLDGVSGGVCKRVYFKEDSNVFGPIWEDDRPLHSLVTRTSWHTPRDIPVDEFIHLLHHPECDEHGSPAPSFYWNADLMVLDDARLRHVAEAGPFLLNPEDSQLNLWIGNSVATHVHFDSYDNFYVQLVGDKHFTLCPPSASAALNPYPFLHPSYSHSQLSATDAESRYIQLEAGCVHAILRPGDMLYIPPFWWHDVVSPSLSVSMNVWSVTQDSYKVEEALAKLDDLLGDMQARCARGHTHREIAIAVTNRLLDQLCNLLGGNNVFCRRLFARLLAEERYKPLAMESGKEEQSIGCPSTKLLAKILTPTCGAPQADDVAAQLAQVARSDIHMWVGNVVEVLVLNAVLDPTLILPTLLYCISPA